MPRSQQNPIQKANSACHLFSSESWNRLGGLEFTGRLEPVSRDAPLSVAGLHKSIARNSQTHAQPRHGRPHEQRRGYVHLHHRRRRRQPAREAEDRSRGFRGLFPGLPSRLFRTRRASPCAGSPRRALYPHEHAGGMNSRRQAPRP